MYNVTVKILVYDAIFSKGYTSTITHKHTNTCLNQMKLGIYIFSPEDICFIYTYSDIYMNQNSEEMHKIKISNLNVL